MRNLPLLSATIMGILALLHLAYTICDLVGEPRRFSPRDRSLLAPMQATVNALAPRGRDYWTALLGFHLSHSIGVLLFALLIVIATEHALPGLRFLLVGLGVAYTWIAWRFWFHIPLIGCAAATALMVAGWA